MSDKSQGIVHTPRLLAEYMTELLGEVAQRYHSPTHSILDPALGDGDLLIPSLTRFPQSHFYGMDIEAEAVQRAIRIFQKVSPKQFDFRVRDYLDSKEHPHMDMILSNPPYVRTQNQSSHVHELEKRYHIKGRMDLYQAFIVQMTEQLKDHGILCMITSNRYLSTQSGQSTRQFLREHYHIVKLIDLGDTDLFDASVLPAIFIGIKDEHYPDPTIDFQRIYRDSRPTSTSTTTYPDIFSALRNVRESPVTFHTAEGSYYRLTTGKAPLPRSNTAPWELAPLEEIQWSERLIRGRPTFSDAFDVHVGIKTNADKVFIRKDWDGQINPSSRLLHPLIASDNIQRWSSSEIKDPRTILYPYLPVHDHWQVIDLDEHPLAKQYFMEHRERLTRRKYLLRSGKRWFEIWVTQDPRLMQKPKVVFPDISDRPKFTLDFQSRLVDGNCYWLSLKNGQDHDYLFLATILANSPIFQRLHDIKFQNRLYAGKRRYLAQYVKRYPLPDLQHPASQELIRICKQITRSSRPDDHFQTVRERVNKLIRKSFN